MTTGIIERRFPETPLKRLLPVTHGLVKYLGDSGTDFLYFGLSAVTRILPHTEFKAVMFCSNVPRDVPGLSTGTHWDQRKRSLHLTFRIGPTYGVEAEIRRKSIPKGVGALDRTLDARERDICSRVITSLSRLIERHREDAESLLALRSSFDERVVADHLCETHGVSLDLARLLSRVRILSEQTYENKPLTFACLIDGARHGRPRRRELFPDDFLAKKRYRALSDGYHTVYRLTGHGKLLEFSTLELAGHARRSFSPSWCTELASQARDRAIAICLTRHGDILVLDRGSLRFSYRLETGTTGIMGI